MRSAIEFTVTTFKGVSGVVRPLDTVYKLMTTKTVHKRLKEGLSLLGEQWEPYAEIEAAHLFSGLVGGESSINGIDGFALPAPSASPQMLADAFCGYVRLNEDIANAIREAYIQTELPMNDRKLLPPEALSEEERNFTLRNESPSG